MNENEEMAYIRGNRAAWGRMLQECLSELGYENPEETSWILEREAAIIQLRGLCAEFGDNDWAETLHLADILEQHLGNHLIASTPHQ